MKKQIKKLGEYKLIEVINKIKELNKQGFVCWIEGCGDGTFKIVIEEDKINIIGGEVR